MCREDSGPSHHGHHHHGDEEHSHHQNDHEAGGPPLSSVERLIIRLQHSIRHNRDHAATYRSMAEDARQIGAQEAARWIRDAAEQSDRQTEALDNAMRALKNQ